MSNQWDLISATPALPGGLFRRYNKFVDGEDAPIVVLGSGDFPGQAWGQVWILRRGRLEKITTQKIGGSYDVLPRSGNRPLWVPDGAKLRAAW